jgi:hypothetical protein
VIVADAVVFEGDAFRVIQDATPAQVIADKLRWTCTNTVRAHLEGRGPTPDQSDMEPAIGEQVRAMVRKYGEAAVREWISTKDQQ